MKRRHRLTLELIHKYSGMNKLEIIDMGHANELSALMKKSYNVSHHISEDFDLFKPDIKKCDAYTSFEVLEHLLNPFEFLLNLNADTLIATVPLRLWFAKAYRGDLREDEFDEHYHEFEPWQFRKLLEKTGWTITHEEFWTNPPSFKEILRGQVGFRSILRLFTKRYMAVVAVRNIEIN